jgi:hypothetical protein
MTAQTTAQPRRVRPPGGIDRPIPRIGTNAASVTAAAVSFLTRSGSQYQSGSTVCGPVVTQIGIAVPARPAVTATMAAVSPHDHGRGCGGHPGTGRHPANTGHKRQGPDREGDAGAGYTPHERPSAEARQAHRDVTKAADVGALAPPWCLGGEPEQEPDERQRYQDTYPDDTKRSQAHTQPYSGYARQPSATAAVAVSHDQVVAPAIEVALLRLAGPAR